MTLGESHMIPTMWAPVYDSVQLAPISPITMVYYTQITKFNSKIA